MNPLNFAINPYKRPSDDRIGKFTAESAKRLSKKPEFSQLIAPTNTAYTNFTNATAQEAIDLALQKAHTAEMRVSLREFKDLAALHAGAIASKFGGRKAFDYTRFYPRGVTEYRQANLENVEEKMTRFEEALKEVGDRLDSDLVADFIHPSSDEKPGKGVILRFREARAAQLEAKAAHAESKSAAHAAREVLDDQLMDNLLTVEDEEREDLMRVFPQHILTGKKRGVAGDSSDESAVEAEAGDEEKVTSIESGLESSVEEVEQAA